MQQAIRRGEYSTITPHQIIVPNIAPNYHSAVIQVSWSRITAGS